MKFGSRVTHRYFAPVKQKEISERFLKYSDAEKLAKDVDFNKNERYFVFINGTFFFGDFIEAWIVLNNIHVKKMTISTLSMNQNNVDSLANLLNGGFVDELNLILSDYFLGHERSGLVPYIYEKLDVDNKFQVAYAGTHCKLCIIESYSGRRYVFHGSANLRSSSNIEQICLEENNDLYLWMDEIQNEIISKYKTINKSIRGKELWQSLEKVVEKMEQAKEKQKPEKENQLKQSVNKKRELRFDKIKF